MFIDYSALHQFAKTITELKCEQNFFESLKDLPIQQRIERMQFHRKVEKERKEKEDVERRHRELCSAIRSAKTEVKNYFY